MEDIDIALKHALGIRWAFMGPFEIMDLNAPEGIKDSFSRYKSGIQNLAREQNSVPEYSEEYLNKLENEQRKRLSYSCLLYTSPSPRDRTRSRMPSSA